MHKKKVVWRWEYGVYVPFCPYCDEPVYDHDRCFNCGKPYEYVDGEYKPKEVSKGEYTIVQSTNNHICLYKDGHMVMHVASTKSYTEEELLQMIDKYPEIKKTTEMYLEKRKYIFEEKALEEANG